jgi:hypothetical protein
VGYAWPTFFYLEREGWTGWPKSKSPAINAQPLPLDPMIEPVVRCETQNEFCMQQRVSSPQMREPLLGPKTVWHQSLQETLRYRATMAVSLLHRDQCWFFHRVADGVPLLGSQQTTRTE